MNNERPVHWSNQPPHTKFQKKPSQNKQTQIKAEQNTKARRLHSELFGFRSVFGTKNKFHSENFFPKKQTDQ